MESSPELESPPGRVSPLSCRHVNACGEEKGVVGMSEYGRYVIRSRSETKGIFLALKGQNKATRHRDWLDGGVA